MSEFQRIVLVHYHEIGLKGPNRSTFEMRIAGRLCVFLREGTSLDVAVACADAIVRVPGVARVSCGYKCERDLDAMARAARDAMGEAGGFSTFKVAARRNHTDFPIGSMDMNRIVGAKLCEAFPEATVRMRDPDLVVGVEVVQNAAYVYARSVPGIGGLPVGSSGTVVGLLSSGIDSPVALWRMARRGAVCVGVHFSGRPQTSDESEYLVDDIARVLERTGCIARVYVVAFGDVQREISLCAPPSLRVILYRRLMFKVAERLAARERAGALVTGRAWGRWRRRPSTTSAPPTPPWSCRCCARSSAPTSWRSSRRRRSWARSRYRRRTRPTAARCSCRASRRRTRS